MLGDAAGLLADDIGGADGVEQRSLAVIDMTHDGDDRRARLEVLGVIFLADEAFLDVGLGDPPDRMPEFLGDELGGVGVDHIGDLAHLTVPHQELDDVDAALGHAVGELLNGNDLGHHDVALDFLLCQRSRDLLFLALLAALQRGKAALALLLVEGVGNGEAPAHAALLTAPWGDGALLVAGVGRAGRFFHLLFQEVLADGLLADFASLSLGLVSCVLFELALLGVFELFRPLL